MSKFLSGSSIAAVSTTRPSSVTFERHLLRPQVGTSTFEQIWLHFASIRNAGYSLEEIMGTDTSVLIDREAFADSLADSQLEPDSSEAMAEGIDSEDIGMAADSDSVRSEDMD